MSLARAVCTMVDVRFVAGALLGIGLAAGCSSASDGNAPGVATDACSDIAVNRFMELEIVDPAVVGDARARNTEGGAWSFRHAVENMAPEGASTSEFVRKWFTEWVTLTQYNSYPLDRPSEGRTLQMNARILCPWYQRTEENGCNSDCSTCAVSPPVLDLAKAPFRLIAITNRIDLREQAGNAKYGEGRLVFGLTNGAADDPASPALPMTMIFEYNQPTSRSLKETAQAWHALGTHAAFDEAYRSELQAITDGFVLRGADPSRPNGSAIGQVRTNESALDWIWQLRQFGLGTDGQMHLSALKNNPAEALNGTPALANWIVANSAAVKSNNMLLPPEMLAGSADQFVFRWTFKDLAPDLRTAFVQGTCNGCHSDGVNPSVDVAFHVSPFREGTAKLSRFVNNPDDPAHDDLARRTTSLRGALCSQ